MNVQDAFYHTVHDYKDGTAALADRMGMSAAILLNKADPNKEHNKPLLKDADMAMGLTGDYRILDVLAQNHGRIVVRKPEPGEACDMAILELMAQAWKSNGEVGSEVHSTLADGKVEKKELPKVRSAIYRAQQALNEMLMRLEGMAE